jgi:hypothetical protein
MKKIIAIILMLSFSTFSYASDLRGGSGGVTSFNSRFGVVVPEVNDYTWNQINKTVSSMADITTRSFDATGTMKLYNGTNAFTSGNYPMYFQSGISAGGATTAAFYFKPLNTLGSADEVFTVYNGINPYMRIYGGGSIDLGGNTVTNGYALGSANLVTAGGIVAGSAITNESVQSVNLGYGGNTNSTGAYSTAAGYYPRITGPFGVAIGANVAALNSAVVTVLGAGNAAGSEDLIGSISKSLMFGTGNNYPTMFLQPTKGLIDIPTTIIANTLTLSGTELVINGDFATGGTWTFATGWTWNGSFADHDTTGTGALTQLITGLTVGKIYALKYDVIYCDSGYVTPGVTSITLNAKDKVQTQTREVFVAIATSTTVRFTPSASTALVGIDNVSLQEVVGGNIVVGGTIISFGNVSVPHLIGLSTTPTSTRVTAGAGANATCTVSGTDLSGIITLVTSTFDTPSASSDVCTVTFNKAYGVAPKFWFTPSNDAAWDLAYGIVRMRQSDITTALFKLRSGPTPLPATTAATYTWDYGIIQ